MAEPDGVHEGTPQMVELPEVPGQVGCRGCRLSRRGAAPCPILATRGRSRRRWCTAPARSRDRGRRSPRSMAQDPVRRKMSVCGHAARRADGDSADSGSADSVGTPMRDSRKSDGWSVAGRSAAGFAVAPSSGQWNGGRSWAQIRSRPGALAAVVRRRKNAPYSRRRT
jgi:hypothetical protein